jgi:hypothetical protein
LDIGAAAGIGGKLTPQAGIASGAGTTGAHPAEPNRTRGAYDRGQ